MGVMTSFRRRFGAFFGMGGFDAALSHRRLRGFRPARAHVNTLLASAGPEMTSRGRWLVRNNGYAGNAVESWAANAVGDGIKPNSQIKTASRKRAVQQLFLDWTDEADAEGLTDFYGLQRRAAREVFVAGEVFLRFRARRPQDGLSVPFQIQMLPSEMLPMDKNELLPSGAEIRQGIEFDLIGRRVAYHFYKRHPGDTTLRGVAAGETVRVPAEDVVHILDPVEAGQLRGVSRFSAAIVKMFLLDQYDDAELDRKKVAALYALFVTSGLGEDGPIPGEGSADDGQEPDPIELSPGTVLRLEEGEDIKVADPAESGSTYEPFQYRTLLQIAAGLGIPYGYLTGDSAKGNFANSRLILMEFRRRVAAFQHGVMVYQMCRAVWARFMDTAVLSGALALPGYETKRRDYLRCVWLPPRWDWVDPQKDIRAELDQIEAGLKSRSQAISERGYDAEQLDAEIAEDRKREKRLGLDFRRAGSPGRAVAGKDEPEDETRPEDRPEDRE